MSPRKKKRKNSTVNRKALSDATVQQLISDLRKRGRRLDRIARGELLCELLLLGCSRRGLARQLHVSPTSIRRYIEIANLRPDLREAVRAGGSAKKALAKTRTARLELRMRERVKQDRETGALSDAVANIILAFCRAEGGLPDTPILKGDVPIFLQRVRERLLSWDASGHPFAIPRRKAGLETLFKNTRPPEAPDVLWMEHQAQWLDNIIRAIAPESPIWEKAFHKVERRARELDPNWNKTPAELYQAALERRQLLQAGIAAGPKLRY